MISSDSCLRRAEIRRLRNPFESAEAANYHLCDQLCSARDRLASKEEKFSVLDADYFRLANDRRCHASNTSIERELKHGDALDFRRVFSFHRFWYDKDVEYDDFAS